jgi:FixJ family two-component response regulator
MTEEQPLVFVIDDDASVRDAVEDLLRSVGLGVESFASTQEFVQGKRPDTPGCIVLDVRLPGNPNASSPATMPTSIPRSSRVPTMTKALF